MAARLWRGVLASEFAFALAVAAIITAPYSLRVSVALAVFCGVQWLLTACSFALAYALGRNGCASSAAWALRALFSESLRFSVATFAMSAEPYLHARRSESPGDGRPLRPVLLIHGIFCNRAVWQPLLGRLRAAGLAPVRAISLEPLLADIESYTADVERELLAMQRRSDGARVAIVAHSMGGLIARAVLRSLGPGAISQIVTVATPHYGTAIARLFPQPCTRQMRPDSPWLRALNSTQPGPRTVPFTSIYSLEDNLIAPARSAALEGARLHELRGLGHVGVLSARRSLDCIVEALTRE